MLKSSWDALSTIGLDETVPKRESIKIKLLNQIAGIAIVAAIILVIFTLVIGRDPANILLQSVNTALFVLFIFYLNYRKSFKLARNISCLLFPIWVFLMILQDGVIIGQFAIFVPCTLLALIQYEEQRTLRVFSILLIIVLIISAPIYLHIQLGENLSLIVETILTFTSIMIVSFIATFYQKNIKNYIRAQNLLVQKLKLKNEELERFAYITSHDLKEPTRNIESFAGLLKKNMAKNESSQKDLELIGIIDTSAKRMSTMIDSILKFSTLDQNELPMEDVDLEEILNEFKQSHNQLLQDKKVSIQYGELPKIIGNKLFLSMLFQNLLENGIKYNESPKPTIEIACEVSDDFANISVKDNGIGIEEEFKEYIFEPFRRLHSRGKYEGTGLGLSICKKIVESHSGTIKLESNSSNGSTFIFNLPLSMG